MSEVSAVNTVVIANIETTNGVDAEDIESINSVDFVTGFSNTYSLKQTTSPYGGYVSIANPSTYHFESGGTDQAFSISLWLKPTYGNTFWSITKGATGGGADREFCFGLWGSGVVIWTLSGNPGHSQYLQQYDGVDRRTTLADGNWHHMAATYDGSAGSSGLTWYLDGTAYTGGRSASGYSSLNNSGLPVRIGGWDGNSNTFLGYMDEVSIWNKELSGTDVTNIYNSGTPTDLSEHASVANLLSWWRMGDNNGGTGTTVTDVQGNGNGTLNGFQTGDGFNASAP
tara:strand:+ start:97 stop:948 length:852 start_codon:yes stop_codon:yes gene_type:complete